MDCDENPDVGGSRKRKKSSLGKDRNKKRSAAGTDTPAPFAAPAAVLHDVGCSVQKPSMTGGAEANLMPAAGPDVAVAGSSKASSSRHSARSEKRRKRGSKTSSASSSSSASSQRSRKDGTADSSKAMAPRPSEPKRSHDPTTHKYPHEEVAVDGHAEKKTTEAVSSTGTAGLSSDRQTLSATGASSSLLAQMASTTTSEPGEANREQHTKTPSGTTVDSSRSGTEQQGSSSAAPDDALAVKDKAAYEAEQESMHTGKAISTSTSCHDQRDTSRTQPAGTSAVVEYQALVPVEVLLDNESTKAMPLVPINSDDRRASASATPKSNDASVVKEGQGGAQTAYREDSIKEEELIEPKLSSSAPQPPPLPSDALEGSDRHEEEKSFDKQERADDTKLPSGTGSETQPEDVHRKAGLGSTVNWSFYREFIRIL